MTKTYPIIHGRGPASSRLIELLEKGKPGDEFTMAELEEKASVRLLPKPDSKEADIKACARGQSALRSAQRYCLVAFRVVWARVRGEPKIRCLDHEERVEASRGQLARARRAARRGGQIIEATEFDSLSEATRAQYAGLRWQTAGIGAIARPAVGKHIAQLAAPPDVYSMLMALKE